MRLDIIPKSRHRRFVTAQDGRVSLEGVVDSWDERQAVERAAWSVAGVKWVDDRLILRRSAVASNSEGCGSSDAADSNWLIE
jgi:hypothetical protein